MVGVDDAHDLLVIGGADETQFGVYYFEDRDDNATIDTADILMLLGIGTATCGGLESRLLCRTRLSARAPSAGQRTLP